MTSTAEAAATAERVAVVRCGDQIRTHDEVRARAARLAGGLAAVGLEHGDRYGIVMRNEIGFIEATLAGSILGAVPVAVNWHWTGDDLAHLLIDSAATAVIVHSDLLSAVEAVVPDGVAVIEAPVPSAVAGAYGFAVPDLTGRYPDTESLIASSTPPSPSATPPLSVIYTSGTTGLPKGILRSPLTPEQSAELFRVGAIGLGLGAARSTMIPAPLYHTAPNTHAVFAIGLGLDLEIMPRFDEEEFLRLIQDRRIEHIQAVPTMFLRVLRLPEEKLRAYDLSSLRAIVHAAAPCPVDTKRRAIELFGPIVEEYYGGSETGMAVYCTALEWLDHPGTVGRPFADAEVRILGPDDEELPAGETGDVYLKPFSAWPDFTYIGNDAKRRDMERDGFVTVGDIGHLDEDGFLFLSDRRNDMVISGGVNIYPAEIEACLLAMPGILDAAVFGIPDAEFGEALAAHLEADEGIQPTPDEVRDWVRSHLAAYKVPRVVVFEEKLPREETGKLFKRRLKEPYWMQADA
ncbi:AMP-binding protein [Gordonia neofelifaecis]|uniref:Fatty-acid--CoA ligase n=1 Tax=Gordonia neofelifaecis NRRL B-59395 TaxID=644548 RepID=F1YFS4_9ACTN|nr:AMP-binding protein [Gordonia neofelifaecis]EGD56501.1 fatty-acid--CoA ligase [Gordonia neofelifaecis NRRL B-59395]